MQLGHRRHVCAVVNRTLLCWARDIGNLGSTLYEQHKLQSPWIAKTRFCVTDGHDQIDSPVSRIMSLPRT